MARDSFQTVIIGGGQAARTVLGSRGHVPWFGASNGLSAASRPHTDAPRVIQRN